jgi:dTDP-4-dehydrorhamnose 3,5-epimerase
VIKGMIKLVLYDNRKNSETYKELNELFIGDKNYVLVTIPPGIINGYKNICDEEAILANCSDLPHEPGEMIRYNPLESFIPYNWEIVNR